MCKEFIRAFHLRSAVESTVDVDITNFETNNIFTSQYTVQCKLSALTAFYFKKVTLLNDQFYFANFQYFAFKFQYSFSQGTLLKHLQEHVLQEGMTSDDVLFFWTTCGWMMWNWLLTSLSIGASVVLYDGSPFEPNPHILFDVTEKTGLVDFFKLKILLGFFQFNTFYFIHVPLFHSWYICGLL